ncbi:MAG: tRNA (adenosine(37)-N6)-threonylcarbamoyltransferase complex dimerization subunit type 1 TsaB [Clostridia bacterium]|nr:tRNA (adenosine(37)-N6)-threonylcarbamoyltransferase complex dimerization subunit type 1 TsaB [Clostridia bacterium]
MYTLAIDTTAKTASVCIVKQEGGEFMPLTHRTENCGFTHSETLLPMIDTCIKGAGITADDLDIIAVSAGPGSFTGVRIGVACAKGISFGLNAKGKAHRCIEVSSLFALAENVKHYSGYIICPVMDARRSQFYNALFKVGRNGELKRLCEDRLPEASAIYSELSEKYAGKKILLVGDGALLCKKLFDKITAESGTDAPFTYTVCDPVHMYQDAYSVAKAALYSKEAKEVSGASLSPIYLRASQAERERLEKEAAAK